MGAEVYLRIWWGSFESDNVSEVTIDTPKSDFADTFQLGSKCWRNVGITPDGGKRWEPRRTVPRSIHAVWLAHTD